MSSTSTRGSYIPWPQCLLTIYTAHSICWPKLWLWSSTMPSQLKSSFLLSINGVAAPNSSSSRSHITLSCLSFAHHHHCTIAFFVNATLSSRTANPTENFDRNLSERLPQIKTLILFFLREMRRTANQNCRASSESNPTCCSLTMSHCHFFPYEILLRK